MLIETKKELTFMLQIGTLCFYISQNEICHAVVQSDDGINDAGNHLYTLFLHEHQRKQPCCLEQDIFLNRSAAVHALLVQNHQKTARMQNNLTDLKSILQFALTHDLTGTDKQARLAFLLAAKQILNIDLTES